MLDKYFIITVDTEGDNLWDWKIGDPISTNNAVYIKRFQELCERYKFVPVYLVNYEMANSKELVHYLKKKMNENKCEVGMHLHAWNTPPEYHLENRFGGCPYITEYPTDIILQKHEFLKEFLYEKFGVYPVSYRSGRWSTNSELFSILDKLGIKIDCSVVPGINYEKNVGMSVKHGNNYRKESVDAHLLCGNLIEVPMSSLHLRSFAGKSFKNKIAHLIKGEDLLLRPALNSCDNMVRLINKLENKNIDFLDLMIHSSELMPGGSPYCKSDEDVEIFLSKIEQIFMVVCNKGYSGVSLKSYYEYKYGKKKEKQ